MPGYTYLTPGTLAEATAAFYDAQGEAIYLAGGTDLMVNRRKGKLSPEVVISLNRLPGLGYIEERDGRIFIGGRITLEELNQSALIAARLPVLADATANMASVQIRNVATMAGNICNAAPSADTAPPLLALGADLVLVGLDGERVVGLEDFFIGPGLVDKDPGEILTGFVIDLPTGPHGGAYAKISRRKAMDLALVGIAVQLELESDKRTCRRARVALGVAGPTPRRAVEAEEHLNGKEINEQTLTEAGKLAAAESSCRDSLRGEAWYRREMIRVYVKRMGLKAMERAR